MGDISAHFSRSEFRSKSRTGPPVEYPPGWVDDRLRPLCAMLEVVREQAGRALYIVSGYRTPAHNVAVGGAPLSQHVQGRAADVSFTARPYDSTPEEIRAFHSMVLRMHADGDLPALGGLGVYPFSGWLHVDVRAHSDGALAQWHGSGTGSEPTA